MILAASFPSLPPKIGTTHAGFSHKHNPRVWSSRVVSRSNCTNNDEIGDALEGDGGCRRQRQWFGAKEFQSFSVLEADIPWDSRDTWSTFATYMFALHVPLSYGGLSVVAQLLHQPVLDPLTMVESMTAIQIIELIGILALFHYTAVTEYQISSFFLGKSVSEERSWVKASALGVAFLAALVFLTSVIADKFIGPKEVNNPIMKEILSGSPLSRTISIFALCFTTPLLEETVYRGFLLTSLVKEMKWSQAVFISACAFSMAHFSFVNFLQFFLVGTVLGSVYCWTGNLAAPIAVHSVYNAMILLLAAIW